MTADPARCELCGEPMPPGEGMFKYHGYSGPCPKPPLKRAADPVAEAIAARLSAALSSVHELKARLYGRSRTEVFLPGSLAPELLRRSEEFLDGIVGPLRSALAALEVGGWQEISTVSRKANEHVDLWARCYFWNADGIKLLAVEFRIPCAQWFDNQWCDQDGNPHPDLEGFPEAEMTHWRPLPSSPPTKPGETT